MTADRAGMGRGRGFGRGVGLDSLAERREAAQRRLSSSMRAAELVDCALRRLDEALTDQGVEYLDPSLRATVRGLLHLAYDTPGYDVTLLPAAGDIAVRVQHTPFGPEAEVVDLGTAVRPGTAAPDRSDLAEPRLAPTPMEAPDAAFDRDSLARTPHWSPWTDAPAFR